MKRLIFVTTVGLASINILQMMSMDCQSQGISGEQQKESQEKKYKKEIRKVLQNTYKTEWKETKEKLTAIIEKNSLRTIDVSKSNSFGYTPLCEALSHDDLGFAEYLLKKGANPNDTIKGVHSDKPIFFAKSLEMVKLLEKYGADIHVVNKGSGVTGDMDLLHASIGCNTHDDRLFDYFLERGFDPRSVDRYGNNLWYNLVWISARYFPEEKLLARARKLNSLGIDPYEKNLKGISAYDQLKKEVGEETAYLNSSKACKFAIEHRTIMRDKLRKVLNVMHASRPPQDSCM